MNCPSVFHSTPSTCSQGSSFSWLLTLCVNPAGTQFFTSWVERTETGGVKRSTPFTLGSTPADLHFRMFLPQLVRVFCIFCAEFFTGLSCRPLETRVGLLYLPPPLTYWVPWYALNSSKFPEDSAIHFLDSPYTLQGIAITLPQMLLITPEPLLLSEVTHLGEHCQIRWKITNSWSLSNKVTRHKTLQHYVEIPELNGICSELIRHFKQWEIFTIFLA